LFTKTPKETDAPALALVFVAVKGEVQIKGKEHEFTLKAPPGPALLLVDGLNDTMPRTETLDKVPAWVGPDDPELLKKAQAGVAQFRDLAEKTSIGDALLKMTQSDEESVRRTAVILFGALDDLSGLAAAVSAAKHQDIAENAVIVLRHWIGRSAGQDLKLYNALMEKKHFKPAEAELVLQLLHSFGDAALKKPETYEALINFLDSDRMMIRTLAHWHLERLVPAGRKIEFKATATKEEREKAVKAWKELVPPGTAPR
jgi:class 3 adenylate cyclase